MKNIALNRSIKKRNKQKKKRKNPFLLTSCPPFNHSRSQLSKCWPWFLSLTDPFTAVSLFSTTVMVLCSSALVACNSFLAAWSWNSMICCLALLEDNLTLTEDSSAACWATIAPSPSSHLLWKQTGPTCKICSDSHTHTMSIFAFQRKYYLCWCA